jgi:hypothetical protein
MSLALWRNPVLHDIPCGDAATYRTFSPWDLLLSALSDPGGGTWPPELRAVRNSTILFNFPIPRYHELWQLVATAMYFVVASEIFSDLEPVVTLVCSVLEDLPWAPST